MVSTGVALAVVFNALLLLGLAAVLLWRRRRGGSDAPTAAAWKADAVALAREVEEIATESDGTILDAEAVGRRLVPVGARLQGHARAAPAAVDSDLVGDCYALGRRCYEIGMEVPGRRPVGPGEALGDHLEDLAADARALASALETRE